MRNPRIPNQTRTTTSITKQLFRTGIFSTKVWQKEDAVFCEIQVPSWSRLQDWASRGSFASDVWGIKLNHNFSYKKLKFIFFLVTSNNNHFVWCWCFVLFFKTIFPNTRYNTAARRLAKVPRATATTASRRTHWKRWIKIVRSRRATPAAKSFISSSIIARPLWYVRYQHYPPPFFFSIPNSFVLVAGCFTFFILREDDAWWCGYMARAPSVSRVPESILSNTITFLFLLFCFSLSLWPLYFVCRARCHPACRLERTLRFRTVKTLVCISPVCRSFRLSKPR